MTDSVDTNAVTERLRDLETATDYMGVNLLSDEMRDALRALLDEQEKREARIAKVVEIHQPKYVASADAEWCTECARDYPCPTVRALLGDTPQ